jgi:hypothetical protein
MPSRQTEGRGITLSILDLSARTGGVVNTTPQPLYSSKRPGYLLDRRLGGPQGQSGWVQKFSPPPGFEPWTTQPAASRNPITPTKTRITLFTHSTDIPECVTLKYNNTSIFQYIM